MDRLPILLIFLLNFIKIQGEIRSPCPKYFVFEPNKSSDVRWYGIISLESRNIITDINLELQFDKSLIQLGNWLGQVKSNDDNTIFKIRNTEKQIRPDKPLKTEIYVVYDPTSDVDPPNLMKIKLNGREICPNYEEEHINFDVNFNKPTIVLNINVPTCGSTIEVATGLITEGQYTVPGQWPWHAALYRKDGNKRFYLCGGSLITDQHLVTAAHCVTIQNTPRNPQDFVIILGKHGIYVDGKDEQIFNIKKISVHENFDRSSFNNDIAILHLGTTAKYSDFVRPVCLWDPNKTGLGSVVNKTGTAVGWGRDHKDNAVTDVLMMAHMPVVDHWSCTKTNPRFYSLFLNDNNFCAGYRNGTSACNGDSGGGLVFPKPGTSGVDTIWQLRGIVSNAVPKIDVCDPEHYIIFTDAAKYLDWINDKTKS